MSPYSDVRACRSADIRNFLQMRIRYVYCFDVRALTYRARIRLNFSHQYLALFTPDNEEGACFRPHARLRLSVCVEDYSKNACMDLDEMLRQLACRQISGHRRTD